MPPYQGIFSETQRKLETALAWAASSFASTRLPLDTVLRGIQIVMSGTVTYTFSSSPVASELSIFDNLVSNINVTVDGGRTVVSVRPAMNQKMMLLATGVYPPRRASAGASAAYANNPLADSAFVYGTTTQTTTILEALYLPFEMLMCSNGRDTTWLNLKQRSSAVLSLQATTLASLDKSTNATFTASSISFEIITVEAKDYSNGNQTDWRRTNQVETFNSQATERVIQLPKGNKVAGIAILAIQDSSGADATASNHKKPNNNSITDIKLRRNGREILSTTFQNVQAQNRARKGINAAFASSTSLLDGYIYLDLLTEGVLGTALDVTRDAGVNTFELLLSTRALDATNNIYPIDAVIETHEIVKVPA